MAQCANHRIGPGATCKERESHRGICQSSSVSDGKEKYELWFIVNQSMRLSINLSISKSIKFQILIRPRTLKEDFSSQNETPTFATTARVLSRLASINQGNLRQWRQPISSTGPSRVMWQLSYQKNCHRWVQRLELIIIRMTVFYDTPKWIGLLFCRLFNQMINQSILSLLCNSGLDLNTAKVWLVTLRCFLL